MAFMALTAKLTNLHFDLSVFEEVVDMVTHLKGWQLRARLPFTKP